MLEAINLPGNWHWSPANNDPMFGVYSYSWSGSTATVKLSSLPGGVYSFVIYSHCCNADNWSGFTVSTSGCDAGTTLCQTAWKKTDGADWNNATTWVEGSMYVRFDSVAVKSAQAVLINITCSVDANGGCLINGLQIQRQP